VRDHLEPVPVPTPRSRGPLGHPTSWVVAGAAIGGLAAYLFQILGTRTLGADAYAPIGVLWTLQYLLVSIGLAAVEAYVTRTVVEQGPAAPRTRQVQRILVRWLVVVAAVTGMVGFALRDRLFAGLGDLALVAALVVLAYGSFTIVRGRAAGTGRFRAYGLASASESFVRLLAAAVALGVAASTRSLAWVFPLGPALVTAWAALRPGRRRGAVVKAAEGPPPTTSPSRFLASTVTANAAVQVLLAAGPLALVVLAASPQEISVFFTTVTLARAPMTLVLNGGLSRVLPPLLRSARGHDGAAALRGPTVLTATVSVVAAATLGALAWLLGPPVVAWLFGAPFRPAPSLAALATVSSVLAVGGLGIGQILIARGREAELPLPWLAGVAAAAALTAVLPGTATERVVVAFTAGLALALAALTWRALSRPRAQAGRPVPGR
jgi:O-antigen/teichoic acid export membrane protein